MPKSTRIKQSGWNFSRNSKLNFQKVCFRNQVRARCEYRGWTHRLLPSLGSDIQLNYAKLLIVPLALPSLKFEVVTFEHRNLSYSTLLHKITLLLVCFCWSVFSFRVTFAWNGNWVAILTSVESYSLFLHSFQFKTRQLY